MVYINLTIVVLFVLGIIGCRKNTAEYLNDLDKKEHKLSMIYPFADWILRATVLGRVLSNRPTMEATFKTLYHTGRPDSKLKLYWCKQISSVIVTLVLFSLLSIISQMTTRESVLIRGRYLERPSVGSGSKQLELKVTLEDTSEANKVNREVEQSRDILINVPERRYGQEEVNRLFQEAVEYLKVAVLGNNQSNELIYENLKLCDNIPGTGIRVEWNIEDRTLIQADGTVCNDKLNLEGMNTSITALLSYREYKTEHILPLYIMPKKYSKDEILKQRLNTAINSTSEQSAYDNLLELPKTLDNYRLNWRDKESTSRGSLLLLGIITAVFVWISGSKELDKRLKLRKDQLVLDYPEVVNKFTLLINAGMTARQAFIKITSDYEKKSKNEKIKKRYAYEEMCNTVREMKLGLPEGIAYEQYGRRIGLVPYIKFSSLISQNLKKGNRGFIELLIQEGINSFEERKEAAKRLGEEASAKLLMPMFIMLIIVFLIILIPAFMSFGI